MFINVTTDVIVRKTPSSPYLFYANKPSKTGSSLTALPYLTAVVDSDKGKVRRQERQGETMREHAKPFGMVAETCVSEVIHETESHGDAWR